MTDGRLRYFVAGLEIAAWGSGARELPIAGDPDRYATRGGALDLELTIHLQPGFRGRASPPPPAFESRSSAPGVLELSRRDSEGSIEAPPDPDAPVRARFTVASTLGAEAAWRVALAAALPRRHGLLLHASAVEADGQGYVFSGRSGAGKSTIAALLSDPHSGRRRLADELLVVRRAPDNSWMLELPPFRGAVGLPFGERVPLAAFHSLVQADRDERAPLDPPGALPLVLENVLSYADAARMAGAALDVAAALVAEIPCYRLYFRKSAEIAASLWPR